MPTPKLVKLFDEYKNIYVRGKSARGRYDAVFTVHKKTNAYVSLEDLREYVKNLQQKYPEQGFELKIATVGKKKFYVITKRSYKLVDGKVEIVRDRVPIYIDLENQEFYVPKSYLEHRKKLSHYIIMRTLGTLGVAHVKYRSRA